MSLFCLEGKSTEENILLPRSSNIGGLVGLHISTTSLILLRGDFIFSDKLRNTDLKLLFVVALQL